MVQPVKVSTEQLSRGAGRNTVGRALEGIRGIKRVPWRGIVEPGLGQ